MTDWMAGKGLQWYNSCSNSGIIIIIIISNSTSTSVINKNGVMLD